MESLVILVERFCLFIANSAKSKAADCVFASVNHITSLLLINPSMKHSSVHHTYISLIFYMRMSYFTRISNNFYFFFPLHLLKFSFVWQMNVLLCFRLSLLLLFL